MYSNINEMLSSIEVEPYYLLGVKYECYNDVDQNVTDITPISFSLLYLQEDEYGYTI